MMLDVVICVSNIGIVDPSRFQHNDRFRNRKIKNPLAVYSIGIKADN